MNLIYHPKADDEVLESAKLYERRSKGLGWRFLRTVQAAELRIVSNPDHFPVVDQELRRCVLSGFPYHMFFRLADEDIFVVAVAHQKRRPGYWRRRVRKRA